MTMMIRTNRRKSKVPGPAATNTNTTTPTSRKKTSSATTSLFNKIVCVSPLLLLVIVAIVIVYIQKKQLQQKQLMLLDHQQKQQLEQEQERDQYRNQYHQYHHNQHNPHRHHKGDGTASSEGDHDHVQQIINGDLHLISVHSKGRTYPSQKETPLYSVTGTFCKLDWNLHKTKPSTVPMSKDLIRQSKYCQQTTVHLDLFQVVRQTKLFDSINNQRTANHTTTTTATATATAAAAAAAAAVAVHSMYPTGFVFHESRCGSTLVANSLAAFDPPSNRVYSESDPPISAVKMYSDENEEASLQLVRDVIFLMGRTNDVKERHLFFKIQSIGVKKIHVFRKAFPNVPWIFVYRDPVQVMRSHLKTQHTTKAVCLRSLHSPTKDLKQLVFEKKQQDVSDLNKEEFCAAHLATLCQVAVREVQESQGLGRAVNYSNLMTRLKDDIIPKHFLGIDNLSDEFKMNIDKVGEHYSKGRDGGQMWVEDSEKKEETAWEELKDASVSYLLPLYEELEKFQ